MIKASYTCLCDQCGATVGVIKFTQSCDAEHPVAPPVFELAYGLHLCQGCETVARAAVGRAEKVE